MADTPLDLVVVIDVGNSGAKIGAVRGDDVAGPMRLPRADARAVRDLAAPMLKGKQAVIAVCGSDPSKIEGLAWAVIGQQVNLAFAATLRSTTDGGCTEQ